MRRLLVALLVPIMAVLGLLSASPASADVVSGGSLTSGTSTTASISVAGRDVQYTFAAVAGQHVTFDVTASMWTNGTAAGTAYLYFYDAAGVQKSSCSFSATPTYCDFTPASTGTWSVVLNPSGNSVGSVTFVYVKDIATQALVSGTSVMTTINRKGQNAGYTFAATAGQHVTFDVTASSWTNGTSAGTSYLYFYDASGTQKSSCSFSSTPTYCDFTPASTGTWSVVLNPSGGSVGNVTFIYAKDIATQTLVSGTSVTTTINRKGQNAGYTFAATAGQHVTFDVTASAWTSGTSSGTAYLYFYDESGVQKSSCSFSSTPTFCDFTPASTGTWSVVLNPSGGSVGNVTFTYVKDIATRALVAGTPVATTINYKGQNAGFTFPAVSGTALSFQVTATNWTNGSAAGTAYLYFYDTSGVQRASCSFTSTAKACPVSPASSGTWTAKLDPSSGATGSATIKF